MIGHPSSPSSPPESREHHQHHPQHHHRPWYKRLRSLVLPADVFRVEVAIVMIALAILLGIVIAYLSVSGLPR